MTDHERTVFINYCRQQTRDLLSLAEQLKKTPLPAHVIESLVSHHLVRAQAYKHVGDDLASVEIETVKGT